MVEMAQPERLRILILYTETGGTHANAARAIIEAIEAESEKNCQVDLVDVWAYAKFPWKYLPQMIFWFRGRQPISKWHIRNSHNRIRLDWFNTLARSYLKKVLPEILQQHPSDLIISVHPITSAPVIGLISEEIDIPFWVVVTDIATRNAFWFSRLTTMTIVPTVKAMNFAAQAGIPFDHLRLMGIPVTKSYKIDPVVKDEVCRALNMDPAKPVILVAGGKKGVGPLDAVAQGIDERFNEINLLVLTGKNESLQQKLSEYNWNNPTHVFGYVNDLWRLMWAADVMVTKAGTGMLAEALSVELPMIVFHRVPYLEDSNVSFLVENGAALWAPTPKNGSQCTFPLVNRSYCI
jgi:UDP-N-acetylglucosamine:LPS N-acetylglucosamine transferase